MRGSSAGIADTLALQAARSHQRHATVLQLLDIFLSALIIGPVVVAYWRGTWMLMEIYIYHDNLVYSSWVSLVIGLVGHLVFTLIQGPMTRWFSPDKHRLTYYVVSRVYTTVFGVVCVNAWRGVWCVVDIYTGKEVNSVVTTTVISMVALAALRTLRNLSAPPFAVIADLPDDYFKVATMFNLSTSDNTVLYVLDVLFSVLVVGNLVVFIWRGGWTIVDIFLFPADPALSAWASLLVGYVVVVVAFSLQPLMKRVCSNLQGRYFRIFVADVYIAFSFIGTINLWRGVWNLLNIYFLPDSPATSNWLTHGVCLIFLMLLNCSNSILVRGVFIDASEENGDCIHFPCSYLRLFVQAKRDLKLQHKGPTATATSKRKYDGENTTLSNNKVTVDSEASKEVHVQLLPIMTSVETPVEPKDDVI